MNPGPERRRRGAARSRGGGAPGSSVGDSSAAGRARSIPPLVARIGWVLLIALVTAALALWRSGSHPRDPRTRASPADALAPVDAYRQAHRLVGASELRESLPYFRRALSEMTTDFCEIHYLYGVAMGALSMQYLPRAGTPVPATRSSAERVGFAREALVQLDRAAELAPDAASGAKVRRYRAEVWTAWGFPWEALASLHDTKAADSTNGWAARQFARYFAVMRNPADLRLMTDSLGRPAAPGSRSRDGGARP